MQYTVRHVTCMSERLNVGSSWMGKFRFPPITIMRLNNLKSVVQVWVSFAFSRTRFGESQISGPWSRGWRGAPQRYSMLAVLDVLIWFRSIKQVDMDDAKLNINQESTVLFNHLCTLEFVYSISRCFPMLKEFYWKDHDFVILCFWSRELAISRSALKPVL